MKVAVFLLPLLCEMAVALPKEYIYFPTAKNWTDAQKYCTQNYGGLATITTDEDYQKAMGEGNSTDSWIGLNRSQVNSDIWLWSYRQPSIFFKWCVLQPNNFNGKQNCVAMGPCGWNDLECVKKLPFYCNSGSNILIKEKKTWNDAHDFCRTFYTGFASMSQLYLAENEAKQIQGESLWAGLHFVNGKWCWVNAEVLGMPNSLPACPAQPYRCGAYNFNTNVWESRNCNEKFYFLCY